MPFSTYTSADEYAYSKSRKLGIKARDAANSRGENPYLPVLDDLVPDNLSLTRINLGLVNIPLNQIAGTGTKGRADAFANNFMPLLESDSEFASKWISLHHSVVEDGVRQPIKALEYMNKFYILEGNKRVSVSKALDALMIEGEVTRIIPHRTGEKENNIYFEFLDFYNDTKINNLWFSEEGSFAKLYELVGKQPGTLWTEEELVDFKAAYYRFSQAYALIQDELTNLTIGDAFLLFLQIYGYDKEHFLVWSELREKLNRLRNELRTQDKDESYSLVMAATQPEKPSFFRQILHPQQKMNVAFVHNRSPKESGWTYWHQLGQNHIESVFGDKVNTRTVSNVPPENCEDMVDYLISKDYNVIFTTSPVLLDGAVKAAYKHPDVKVLNCSLLPSYYAVRSYYLRIYEAKFIIGAIAGAVCDNNRIGYVADYPVYGVPASINAFALGARLTNPRAKVYLEWSSIKDHDPMETFLKNDVQVISNRDISAPAQHSMDFGLYLHKPGGSQNLAMPMWNWGQLYEDLLRRVQNGTWESDASQNGAQALNYWWGMDSGAIDVFYSHKLERGTRRMAELLREAVRSGYMKPFAESIFDQNGARRCASGGELTPAEIISMDWLCDNVEGYIPSLAEMRLDACAFVEKQGIHSIKAPDTSEIRWTDPTNEEE